MYDAFGHSSLQPCHEGQSIGHGGRSTHDRDYTKLLHNALMCQFFHQFHKSAWCHYAFCENMSFHWVPIVYKVAAFVKDGMLGQTTVLKQCSATQSAHKTLLMASKHALCSKIVAVCNGTSSWRTGCFCGTARLPVGLFLW